MLFLDILILFIVKIKESVDSLGKRLNIKSSKFTPIFFLVFFLLILSTGVAIQLNRSNNWKNTLNGVERIYIILFSMKSDMTRINVSDVWLDNDQINQDVLGFLTAAKGPEMLNSERFDILIQMRLYYSEKKFTYVRIEKNFNTPVSLVTICNRIFPGYSCSYDTVFIDTLVTEILAAEQ